MATNLLALILSDTFVKTLALKKAIALKDYLLAKIFSLKDQSDQTDPWTANLNPALFTEINQQNVYEIFDQLEKSIKAIEPLVLYIPYELPAEYISEIGQTLRANYGNNFLMDIRIDPNLIAGAALSYKGIYKDFSVKQKIFDHRQSILTAFRKYIKH